MPNHESTGAMGRESDHNYVINVVQLATARAAELSAFEASVDRLTARALTGLQRLPLRLRRRAASHQINRLPRRLHQHHPLNLSKRTGDGPKSEQKESHKKPKCRRFRRRRLRLISVAARFAATRGHCGDAFSAATGDEDRRRRQSDKPYWLPTHLWHAKRFHMIDRWGWRLPNFPNDKIFKACQKSAMSGCLVVDLSYLNCLHLSGSDELIQQCLQSLVEIYPDANPCDTTLTGCPSLPCEQTGLFFAQSAVGTTSNLTRPVLGPVRILWGPVIGTIKQPRYVLIWLHPAMSQVAERLLRERLSHLNDSLSSSASSSSPVLELTNWTGRVARLSTLGRQSHQLAIDVFKSRSEKDPHVGDWGVWTELGDRVRQASCLPMGSVLWLPDCEPFRQNRPKLKVRNRNWLYTSDTTTGSREVTTEGGLISSGKRIHWTELERKGLASSLNFSSDSNTDQINVLLVQNGSAPLLNHSPQSVGWDAILFLPTPTDSQPIKTAQSTSLAVRDLLIGYVYRGAQVGGLREWQHWSTLGSVGSAWLHGAFPSALWPDTPSGLASDKANSASALEKHDRRPSNLHPDYTRLGTEHPFSSPWSELVRGYHNPVDATSNDDDFPFFVLRDRAFLPLIVQRMMNGDPRAKLSIAQLAAHHPDLPKALIMVRIKPVGRGVPQPHAVLFATNAHDTINETQSTTAIDTSQTNSVRPVLGYVESGGFHHGLGRSIGLGFVSLAAVVHQLYRSDSSGNVKWIWMKNTCTTCMRPARLRVVF